MSAPIPVGVEAITGSITAAVIAVTALVTSVMKWIASRDHNPRIAVLESQVEKFDDAISAGADEVQKNAGLISVLSNTVPGLQDQVKQHQAQLVELQKDLLEASQKIKELQALVPEGQTVTAKALITRE